MTRGHFLSTISLVAAASLLSAASCTPQGKNADPKADPKAGWRQGWDQKQRLGWYQGSQGSRLMPFAWAKALEQKGNDKPFLAPDHMAGFRFLALPESADQLPVGFARDRQNDDGLSFTRLRWFEGQKNNEDWLGLNCSACHTAEMTYQGAAERIDGGPSLVDFQSFIEAVDGALVATRDDDAKWDRFAAKVLTGRDSPSNREMLKTELGKLIAWEQDNARLNDTPLRYGYGRLDAFGHIFNKVSQLAVYQTAPRVRAVANPADAPVSYPFLWDIYRQNKLQWNGIVETKRIKLGAGFLDYGALGRNTGEVIGVFGDVVIKPEPDMHGFPSSIQADNLNRLETVLRRLESPKWPDRFGALDQSLVDAGRTLFEKKGCLGCHTIEPKDSDKIYEVHMMPLTRDSGGTPNRNNTDPWMACNAISYTSNTGKLEGRPATYLKGTELGKAEPVATMLSTSVIGSLLAKWKELVGTAASIFIGVEKPPKITDADERSEAELRALRLDQCFKSNSPLFAYKARPLDGIWATAPYLHNGSVPTLYDLLLPPDQRPASFNVGTREFDPAKVGYVTGADAPGNGFTFTATGNGNSNEGHDYNVGKLTPQERSALLEYLKTL